MDEVLFKGKATLNPNSKNAEVANCSVTENSVIIESIEHLKIPLDRVENCEVIFTPTIVGTEAQYGPSTVKLKYLTASGESKKIEFEMNWEEAGNLKATIEMAQGKMLHEKEVEDSLEAVRQGRAPHKSPWNPTTFYAIAILLGFGTVGIIAGINYGRLGKENLRWPTIIASLFLFVAIIVGYTLSGSAMWWLFWVIGLLIAGAFHRLQGSMYKEWKVRNPIAKGGGWLTPVGVGIGTGILLYAVVFIVGMVALPGNIQEVGDIKPIIVGEAVNGSIASWDDLDGYSLEAEEGECYVIYTTTRQTSDPLEDSFLTLWYGDGITVLKWDDDSGVDYNARIEWTCEATGTYFITVENADMADTGDYTLLVTCTSK